MALLFGKSNFGIKIIQKIYKIYFINFDLDKYYILFFDYMPKRF